MRRIGVGGCLWLATNSMMHCAFVESFLVRPNLVVSQTRTTTSIFNSITEEELSQDPFMKQITYADELLLPRLQAGDETVTSLLKAQLSHADGIRGFFVAYLTAEEDISNTIPEALCTALKDSISDDLIDLACMNVVMPTGVATLHNSADLQENSRRTAKKATQVLTYLRSVAPESVEAQCRAILAATKTDGSDDDKVQYWRRFFDTYGYKEEQQKDIAAAMERVLE